MKRTILAATLTAMLAATTPANAVQHPTDIKFAKGSLCGTWTGPVRGSKEFALRINGPQRVTVRGSLKDVTVDAEPFPDVEKVGAKTWEFVYLGPGDVYIATWARSSRVAIEFCAYDWEG